MGLRRDPQPPMPIVIPSRSSPTTSASLMRLSMCSSRGSTRRDDAATVAEEALVDRETDARTIDLALPRRTAQLPRELAQLRDRLRRDRLAEAGEPAAGIHRDATAERGVALAQELLGLARPADPDVLVPVELERGGEVVHLREAEVVGPDAGLLVGRGGDRVAV